MSVYSSPFTQEIEVLSQRDALYAINHFCEYCEKGAIGWYHCAGVDSAKCDEVKTQIKNDWFNRAMKNLTS